MSDQEWMEVALQQADLAEREEEVPVGAVIVMQDNLVSVGRNRRERGKNALYHAEIEAINNACKILGGWRLWQCELFVTLEPCPMCAGAIINARLRRVVFGAFDLKAGACGSVINLFEQPFNHKPELVSGVLEKECSEKLTKFFRHLRDKKSKV